MTQAVGSVKMNQVLFSFLIGIIFAFSVEAQAVPDLILFNGKVFTSDVSRPNAGAIAVKGGLISAVGSDIEIKNLAGSQTRLIDLQGRTVIPGINDAHFHFSPHPKGIDIAFESMEPSWDEAVKAIQNELKQAAKGTWIYVTVGGDAMADAKADRFALDQAAPDNPVVINTYYGHGQILNSQAMARLGITESQADPMGGYFERDAKTKELNGRLWEYAQWRQDRKLADMVSDQQAIAELKKMASEAAGFGITSMQIMSTMRNDRFVRLLKKADLPIQVRAIPFSLTSAEGRDISEIGQLSKRQDPRSKVTAGGIKWILDGTPFEHGAALRKPYNDRPGFSGKLDFPGKGIPKMVRESMSFDQQLLVHCAGDKPIELVFDAMESSKQTKWPARRPRIEHGDGLTTDLFARAKKLGAVVVQNPTHLSLVEMVYARFSPQTNFFNLRSLIDAGIPLALGSDGPMNPYLNIMLASINPARPSEAITRQQAVNAYTAGSAFAEFAEKRKGTISVGKFADLAVLSQDIFSVAPDALPGTGSVLTIMGGKIAFESGAIK